MNKYKLLGVMMISATVMGVFSLIGAIGLNSVIAASREDNHSTIVQNIASKFKLNPVDVEKVFEDTRTEEQNERLDQAVEDGDITSAQKDLILKKHEEVKAKLDEINNKELTQTERRSEMKTVLDDLRDWENENDIPRGLLGMMGGRKMGGGMMGEGEFRIKN